MSVDNWKTPTSPSVGSSGKEPIMLSIRNLHVSVEGDEILRGLNLEVGPGQVHAIMGPNGSGKSTLANVIAGHGDYLVTGGSITYLGRNLLEMPVEERAREGVFLSFQYPVEIPGLSTAQFMRSALNSVLQARGEAPVDAFDFMERAGRHLDLLEMDRSFLSRSLNEGFSGGEKKRNEVFQMAMLEPKLAVLDETDSGLDIDSLRIVARGVQALRTPRRSMIVITHYQRLLDHLVPDFTHVLAHGRIIRSGGRELVRQVEERGYGWLLEELPASAPAGA